MASSGLTSRAIIGTFYRRIEDLFDATWWGPLVFRNNSDQQYEEYRFLGQVPPFRKWTGQRAPYELSSKKVLIANEVWEDSLFVPTDDLRRDKTGQILVRANELADRFGYLMEERITTLITEGDSTTGFAGLAYDGQQFFDTDHSEGDSGTLQNNIDATDVTALDVTTAAAPTQAEMAAIIMGVIAYTLQYKDDRGEPMMGGARKFAVVVPTNLWGAALAATRNQNLIGASGAMTDNVLLNSGFSVEAYCNPRLDADSTTVGYIFRLDGNTKPFILQEEIGMEVKALAEGSEYALENRRHLYTAEWIGGFGYGQWQYGVRFTLS